MAKVKDKPKEETASMGAPKKESEEKKYEGAPNLSVLIGWYSFAKGIAQKNIGISLS